MAALVITKTGSSDSYVAGANQKLYTYAPGNGRDIEGYVRRKFFTITLSGQDSLTYGIHEIPKGSRIFGVTWIQPATFGATATLAIGLTTKNEDGLHLLTGTLADGTAVSREDDDATSKGFFRLAATQATTTILTFGTTVALGWGFVPSKDVVLTFTAAAAAFPSSGVVTGYVDYALGH